MSAGTDFIPTAERIPRKYKYAEPIRFNPAVSVSETSRERNALSPSNGRTLDFENSNTSVRVGKKYITFKPMTQAWILLKIAHVVPPIWAALLSTTCGAPSS